MTGGTYWYSILHGWVWKWHEWQDVIDWTLSAAGALSLVALNVIRLRKVLREHRDVDKPGK